MSSSLFLMSFAFLVHLRLFVRWEVSGLLFGGGAPSRVCSKPHVTFLCGSHLVFSSCVLLVSMWYIHAVVLTQPQFQERFILCYSRDQFHIINNLSVAVHDFVKCMLKSLLFTTTISHTHKKKCIKIPTDFD